MQHRLLLDPEGHLPGKREMPRGAWKYGKAGGQGGQCLPSPLHPMFTEQDTGAGRPRGRTAVVSGRAETGA